ALSNTGKIQWSWHLWILDGFDPVATGQVYTGNSKALMDRNLGALSAAKGDSLANGMLYQWGRKDPFPGLRSKDSGNTAFASSPVVPSKYVTTSSYIGKVDYTVQYPTTYICGIGGNYNWNATEPSDLWASKKTVYDPCPPGWKVPDANTNTSCWSKVPRAVVIDEVNCGVDLAEYVGLDECWYPIAGYRSSTEGSVEGAPYLSFYWGNSKNDFYAYMLEFCPPDLAYVSNYTCAAGGSIRCARE
nr:hypothetical protein [Bacteroidales bacterium]